MYRYAANNPVKYTDPDGNALETACDVFSLAMGVKSFVGNVRDGNFRAAAIDGLGIVADAAAVAMPFIPGGASNAIRAVRIVEAGANAMGGALTVVDGIENGDALEVVSGLMQATSGTKSFADTALDSGISGLGNGAKPLRSLDNERRAAVRQAWRDERALVASGKRGTREWTKAEIVELLTTGKVKGYHGHHINSVKAHPELAGNPNNVIFKTRTEHLDAHGGDFRKATKGALVDRRLE